MDFFIFFIFFITGTLILWSLFKNILAIKIVDNRHYKFLFDL